MNNRLKWLMAVPSILLFTLGVPFLMTGDLFWFLRSWSDTTFVMLALATGMGATAFVDSGRSNRAQSLSRLLISMGLILFISFGFLEHIYGPASERSSIWSMVGLILCSLTVPFGIGARLVLGPYYVPDPEILPGQTLVTHGPYRYLRHPLYTAALLWSVGVSLIARSLWGIAVIILILLPAMLLRIREEEAMLLNEFGDDYRAYVAQTWALFPYVY